MEESFWKCVTNYKTFLASVGINSKITLIPCPILLTNKDFYEDEQNIDKEKMI